MANDPSKKEKDYGFRTRATSTGISFFLYLFVASLPFSDWLQNNGYALLTSGLLRLAVGGIAVFFFIHDRYQKRGILPNKAWTSLLFLPLFLFCFTNLIYLPAFGVETASPDGLTALYAAVYCLGVAFGEEMVFRLMLENIIAEKMKKPWALLISAAAFSLAHLVNLFSLPVGSVMAQVGYTFVLGLLLGLLYLYGGGAISVFLFHFLFDFFQAGLFSLMAPSFEWDGPYILYSCVFGGVILLYAVLVFLIFLFKEKKAPEDLPPAS